MLLDRYRKSCGRTTTESHVERAARFKALAPAPSIRNYASRSRSASKSRSRSKRSRGSRRRRSSSGSLDGARSGAQHRQLGQQRRRSPPPRERYRRPSCSRSIAERRSWPREMLRRPSPSPPPFLARCLQRRHRRGQQRVNLWKQAVAATRREPFVLTIV